MKALFKKGDKVRVIGISSGRNSMIGDMDIWHGKIVTIKSVLSRKGCQSSYYIKEAPKWIWSESCFEPAEEDMTEEVFSILKSVL